MAAATGKITINWLPVRPLTIFSRSQHADGLRKQWAQQGSNLRPLACKTRTYRRWTWAGTNDRRHGEYQRLARPACERRFEHRPAGPAGRRGLPSASTPEPRASGHSAGKRDAGTQGLAPRDLRHWPPDHPLKQADKRSQRTTAEQLLDRVGARDRRDPRYRGGHRPRHGRAGRRYRRRVLGRQWRSGHVREQL
jgi:hypothetical protein